MEIVERVCVVCLLLCENASTSINTSCFFFCFLEFRCLTILQLFVCVCLLYPSTIFSSSSAVVILLLLLLLPFSTYTRRILHHWSCVYNIKYFSTFGILGSLPYIYISSQTENNKSVFAFYYYSCYSMSSGLYAHEYTFLENYSFFFLFYIQFFPCFAQI